MTPARELELRVLEEALGRLVANGEAADDPVLAGGLCVLHSNQVVTLVSVEAEDCDEGTRITMAVALLRALVEEEADPRVRERLQQSLSAATQAQVIRVTPFDTARLN